MTADEIIREIDFCETAMRTAEATGDEAAYDHYDLIRIDLCCMLQDLRGSTPVIDEAVR